MNILFSILSTHGLMLGGFSLCCLLFGLTRKVIIRKKILKALSEAEAQPLVSDYPHQKMFQKLKNPNPLLFTSEGRQLLYCALQAETLVLLGSVSMILLFLLAGLGAIQTLHSNTLPVIFCWVSLFFGCLMMLLSLRYIAILAGSLLCEYKLRVE